MGMSSSAIPLDPITGRCAVKDKKTGKIRWLHGIDAREQLERGGVVLANAVEAPHTVVGKGIVDWTGVSLEKLREHAQNAGVSFIARTREMIEADLTASGFVPPQEPTT